MVTSRQRLIRYLQEHREATPGEICRALHVTPANARHHLRALVDEGLVEVVGQRPGQGRGRPSQIYSLVEQAQANSFDRLADALLDELLEGMPEAERPQALERVARRLLGSERSGGGQEKAEHLTRRLVLAVQRLIELNYQARWEARAMAPHLILGHCPYAAILGRHPELCQMDVALLSSLVGEPARLEARLAQDTRGTRYCLFVIGKKPL